MDSGKIKALATGARVQLMDGVRASLERVLAPDSPESINDRGRVNELRNEAKDKEALIERVAYTWFNRLCALRLMDSRGYTPVPVVTPHTGETMPAILADARRGVFCADFPLRPADKQRVMDLVSGNTESINPLGEAYVMLLLSACDYYAKPIPALFGSDPRSLNAMRVLAPTSLLADGSVLQRIVMGMDDISCKDVEIMGWLYQYYIAERKEEVFEGFKHKKKAGPNEIGPATQLFTPRWIVRYLVENSLGRLWMLNFPDSGLIERMEYYITPENPETDFLRIDGPEDITFLDPAMGSSHILVYAFDLLYEMYLEEGYRPAEIPTYILKNNLTGFEIDDRAYEIASFSLTMKAREKDERYFEHVVQQDLTVFHSIQIDVDELQDAGLIVGHTNLINALTHLGQIGSLYQPEPADAILLDNAAINLAKEEGLFAGHALGGIHEAAQVVNQLTRRFSVVAANPPYMGSGNMNAWLSEWVANAYPDEKSDLCTCFINRCNRFVTHSGYVSMITASSWMFISSFEQMRRNLLHSSAILSMIQQSTHGYPSVTVPTTMFTIRQSPSMSIGSYIRLEDFDRPQWQQPRALEAIRDHNCYWFYVADATKFSEISGSPIAYWATDKMRMAFREKPIENYMTCKSGITTGSTDFIRLWFEVGRNKLKTDCKTAEDMGEYRWFPLNSGGDFRKYYGNNNKVVNLWHNGYDITHSGGNYRLREKEYYFQEGLTWGRITSAEIAFREVAPGSLFGDAGPVGFVTDKRRYLLGFLSSTSLRALLEMLNPTLNFQIADINRLPLAVDSDYVDVVEQIVGVNIANARDDWDAFETSWDFTTHPLVSIPGSIREAAEKVEAIWNQRFDETKENEEELNRIFARIYGLDGEVPIEVPDERVSAHRFSQLREVRSLVSYAVGCMFGRYSLDMDGLILADQDSTVEDYLAKIPSPSFMPDEDGILPITEEEWFEDDIITEFWRWLKAAFGEEHFDENLAYIEETLGCKLREYFIKGKRSAFYDDHCKTYSVTGSGKRPIYWMFSSPKSSFNCLVYLHRYDDRTVSKILTDYVRELRRKLEIQARSLEASDIARDRTRADKYHDMIDELNDWERDVLYPMAQRHIRIDLDDGVRHNYKLFPGALRKVTGLS